jgi:hypothetical protein
MFIILIINYLFQYFDLFTEKTQIGFVTIKTAAIFAPAFKESMIP